MTNGDFSYNSMGKGKKRLARRAVVKKAAKKGRRAADKATVNKEKRNG